MILDAKFSSYFKNIEQDFKIDCLGCAFERRFEESFDFDGESHEFLEMVYVEEGGVEIVENDKVYLLGAGDVIFHAPMEFHRIKSADGTSPRVYNLSVVISGSVPASLYRGVFCLDASIRDELLRIFKLAQHYLKNECGKEVGSELADSFAALLRRICRETDPQNSIVSEPGAMLYKALARTMRAHVCDNVTLEYVAKENHVSVSHIKTIFRIYANTSPKNYYVKLRTAEAARLLSLGESAASVAEKMKFSSAAYFTAFFKKNMGVSPSEYKKEHISRKMRYALSVSRLSRHAEEYRKR